MSYLHTQIPSLDESPHQKPDDTQEHDFPAPPVLEDPQLENIEIIERSDTDDGEIGSDKPLS